MPGSSPNIEISLYTCVSNLCHTAVLENLSIFKSQYSFAHFHSPWSAVYNEGPNSFLQFLRGPGADYRLFIFSIIIIMCLLICVGWTIWVERRKYDLSQEERGGDGKYWNHRCSEVLYSRYVSSRLSSVWF